MLLPPHILALENRAIGDHGEPMLGLALEACISLWHAGDRERELRLHLLFLAWYCNLEPAHLTGADSRSFGGSRLAELFFEVFQTFEQTIRDDPECLYVVGLMATLTPYLLGDTAAAWKARAASYRERYRQLLADGLDPDVFKNRGAYGDYFAGQVVVPGGF